jgi:hypothetical protein
MISRDQILGVLTEAFPDFSPGSRDADLHYVVLGDFASYLIGVYRSGSEGRIKKAVELVERLHVDGDAYVKEAATIGLLEGIRNTWKDSGIDPEAFGARLLPESRRWWDSLNGFWQKEIPYVGADLKTDSAASNGSPATPLGSSGVSEGPPSVC